MSNLTNNTAELNKILAAVNALPEAGGGGINPTGTIEITENGTYDVTSYAEAVVEVEVPAVEPVLQEGSATPTKSQQTVEPPSGVDGFSKFVVEKIPDEYIVPTGKLNITENGDHDVTEVASVHIAVPDIPAVTEELSVTENGTWEPGTGVDGFSKVVVNVPDTPAVVEPLEVTENGTYTAPAGVDGYSPVTVNVPSENLDAEISEQAAKIDQLLTILDGKAVGGGSGGDTSTGFCTIEVGTDYPFGLTAFYLGDNGWVCVSGSFSRQVSCGSVMCVYQSGYLQAIPSVGVILGDWSGCGFVYQVPNTPGDTIGISVITD